MADSINYPFELQQLVSGVIGYSTGILGVSDNQGAYTIVARDSTYATDAQQILQSAFGVGVSQAVQTNGNVHLQLDTQQSETVRQALADPLARSLNRQFLVPLGKFENGATDRRAYFVGSPPQAVVPSSFMSDAEVRRFQQFSGVMLERAGNGDNFRPFALRVPQAGVEALTRKMEDMERDLLTAKRLASGIGSSPDMQGYTFQGNVSETGIVRIRGIYTHDGQTTSVTQGDQFFKDYFAERYGVGAEHLTFSDRGGSRERRVVIKPEAFERLNQVTADPVERFMAQLPLSVRPLGEKTGSLRHVLGAFAKASPQPGAGEPDVYTERLEKLGQQLDQYPEVVVMLDRGGSEFQSYRSGSAGTMYKLTSNEARVLYDYVRIPAIRQQFSDWQQQKGAAEPQLKPEQTPAPEVSVRDFTSGLSLEGQRLMLALAWAAKEDPSLYSTQRNQLQQASGQLQEGQSYPFTVNSKGRFVATDDTPIIVMVNPQEVNSISQFLAANSNQKLLADEAQAIAGSVQSGIAAAKEVQQANAPVYIEPVKPVKPAPTHKDGALVLKREGDVDEVKTLPSGHAVQVSERVGNHDARLYQEDAFIAEGGSIPPGTNIADALRTAYAQTNNETSHLLGGATATTTVIDTNRVMTTAYLGDSPVMVFVRGNNGKVRAYNFIHDEGIAALDGDGKPLSVPPPGFSMQPEAGVVLPVCHHPGARHERERLKREGVSFANAPEGALRLSCFRDEAGSVVANVVGINAVMGSAVSGSLGDGWGGHFVRRVPQTFSLDLNQLAPNGEEVIVCSGCDGLLEGGIGLETYRKIVQEAGENRQDLAQKFTEAALKAGSKDNITAMITEVPRKPEQAIIMGVYDGHGPDVYGKDASRAIVGS